MYQVIVGNMGSVCDTDSERIAKNHYRDYVAQSTADHGRASGEPVTLMHDGEPVQEFRPQTITIEVTDTFGGEPNYAWVRRYKIRHAPDVSDLALTRRVKAKIGWSGMPCRTSRHGDMIELRPIGKALVCFVAWEDWLDETDGENND